MNSDFLQQLMAHVFGAYQLQGMGPDQRQQQAPDHARLVDYIRSIRGGSPIAGNMNPQLEAILRGRMQQSPAATAAQQPVPAPNPGQSYSGAGQAGSAFGGSGSFGGGGGSATGKPVGHGGI